MNLLTTKDLYIFRELGLPAKNRAIGDYIDGWAQTHPDDDLSDLDVGELLDDDEILYTKDGQYIGEIVER